MCSTQNSTGAGERMMSPARGISRGDVGSELPKTSSLANLPGTRASRREQTSSCACSNSKTCKTHRHSAGNKEHTGSTLTARTGFCLLGLLRKKPLHWRWGGQAGGEHTHACAHMHTRHCQGLPGYFWFAGGRPTA